MRYELTRHAEAVLKERRIPLEWVEQVADSPERVEPDPQDPHVEHRLGRIKEYENRVLRVILNMAERPGRIVTAYFDRRMGSKL